MVSFGVVDIDPSGRVFLAAEGLEVVAHGGRDSDFKVVGSVLEVIAEVVQSSSKILDTSGLSVDEHVGYALHEA